MRLETDISVQLMNEKNKNECTSLEKFCTSNDLFSIALQPFHP